MNLLLDTHIFLLYILGSPQWARLPALHHDPFDRMLVCQALEHHLTLVTMDTAILPYPVAVLAMP